MPNLIVVCGPQAVGKMTVAESLRDKLRYNLMINHDSIEVSDRIFGFGTPAQREFNSAFREKAFEVALKHGVDLIFTYVCAFDMESEKVYLEGLERMFVDAGGSLYFLELSCDLDTRLKRNETPHRMERKPSKRDLVWSRSNLISDARNHRLNTDKDEYWFENHLKIDNTHLLPDEVAEMAIKAFSLMPNDRADSEYRWGV